MYVRLHSDTGAIDICNACLPLFALNHIQKNWHVHVTFELERVILTSVDPGRQESLLFFDFRDSS